MTINTDDLLKKAALCIAEGKTAEATRFCQAVLNYEDKNVQAHYFLGKIALKENDFDKAIQCFKTAVNLNPDYTNAWFYLGKVFDQTNQQMKALDSYYQALSRQSDNPVLYFATGVALQKMENVEGAIQCYQMAVHYQPEYWEAYNNLSCLMRNTGQWDLSLDYALKAVSLQPENCSVLNSLGSIYKELGYYRKAIACFQKALRIKSDDVITLTNLGDVFLAGRDIDKALFYTEKAIQIQPDYIPAHWHRALIWLISGNFKDGWREYEWRWQTKDFQSVQRNYTQPLWDGGEQPEKTLLIWAEQGVGDAIQFVRYVERVRNRVGRIILEVPATIHRLISHSINVDKVISPGEESAKFDLHIPLLSLPRALYPTDSDIPNRCPYLSPPTEADSELTSDIDWNESEFKVGIVWAGNPRHANDHNRSCPLKYFTGLMGIPGISFYSLQKGPRSTEVKDMAINYQIHDLSNRLQSFTDTAVVMQNLDLVISVDTAVAHLAGALAVPTWLLLPFNSDWRWFLDRSDSPWYPSMRIFRQTKPGDWDSLFEQVSLSLKQLISST